MTLRHLNIFLAVCDAGNMTAAAEKLHIAQPSVSQAIAELEMHYGIRLFERLGRKLFITHAGQKLSTYARHILNLMREAEEAMHEIHDRGVIRVGASVTVGTCILPQLIKKFAAGNAAAKVISTVNNTKIVEDMILLDQVDLGLVEGRIHSPGIVVKPFMEDELVLVTAPAHVFANARRVDVRNLEHMEFLVREEGSGTRELFETALAERGISWKIAGVYNNAEAIKDAVAEGVAITVMSKMAVQKEVQRKDLAAVSIEGVNLSRHFSIVHHKNKFISPLLNRFIQLCLTL
ncbi:hypothetical protein P22_3976 [Propionispora sp. 2/2-37]|uniref:LysR family transcriptional regulator n=1 Tax=Propionispora sp. 2/2-37 TaxID=1677858 RepID=UPI0006BB55FF|nr:LysR family transcriptional regulator [Propionispora sp. 2/2-37]CUH97830.1 hypothetical protein P22_3976 [Propionispora sp. 2/2-37]